MKKKIYFILGVIIFLLLVIFDIVPVVSFNSSYKAIFLTNNQVYFGKLRAQTLHNYILTDIYYLQETQGSQLQKVNSAQQIQLVKLGSEIHGPEDKMKINKNLILFIENLKKDSFVVKSINEYKEKGRSN